jgi:hypothetical protein
MRFHRDEYLDLMNYGPAHRPMFVELFGPLMRPAGEQWIHAVP